MSFEEPTIRQEQPPETVGPTRCGFPTAARSDISASVVHVLNLVQEEMKGKDGIYTDGGARAAWFKDSEGNILALIQSVA